jgi:hypothetical protein
MLMSSHLRGSRNYALVTCGILQFLEEDSPYPEVRCAVSNTDDPDMPCSTLRAWFLGVICSIVFPGLNQFLFFRYPTVVVGPVRFVYPLAEFIAHSPTSSARRILRSWLPFFYLTLSAVYGRALFPG